MVDQSFCGYHSYCESSFIQEVRFTGQNIPVILTFFDFSLSFIHASGFLLGQILLGLNTYL